MSRSGTPSSESDAESAVERVIHLRRLHLGLLAAPDRVNAGQSRFAVLLHRRTDQQERVHRDLVRLWAQTWTVQDVTVTDRHRAEFRCARSEPTELFRSGVKCRHGRYGADYER